MILLNRSLSFRSALWHGLLLGALSISLLDLPVAATPAVPKTFDKSTVETLIQNIDKPQNAAILRVVYFGRRGHTYPFAVENGWEVLNQAVAVEKPKTKRWFLLQRIRANVALQLQFVDPTESISIYKELFDQAKSDEGVDTEYAVRAAIYDYVELIISKMGRLGFYHTKPLEATTLAAWQAYTRSAGYSNKYALRVPRPNWISALKRAGVPEGMKALLQKQIAATESPSYDLLSLYSYVLGDENDLHAVEVLRSAEGLLPKLVDGNVDKVEAKKYYSRLYNLYKKMRNLEQADWASKKLASIE